MDQDAKKTALRMIPYGIYVLTADDGLKTDAAPGSPIRRRFTRLVGAPPRSRF
jgi:hypothetical protein